MQDVTIEEKTIPKGYKNSTLGVIPKNWDVMRLGDITNLLTNGFVGKAKDHYVDEANGILYIQGFNVTEVGFNFKGIKYVSLSFDSKNKKSKLKEDDLLTIQTGDVGVTSVVPKSLEGSNCHALVISRYKSEVAYSRFYHQYFNSIYGRKKFKIIETGSTMKHLNVGDMTKVNLPVPPINEQKVIVDCLSTWDKAIEKLNQLIAQKELRKKGLMQELLFGIKRLKGFNSDWKECLIRDIATEMNLKNKLDKQLTVLSCTKYDGLVPSLEYFGRRIFSEDISTYKIVSRNHFAYATNHIEEGSLGYQERFDEALISPMYTVFKTSDLIDDVFFYKLLKSHRMVAEYGARMEGSIDRRGGLRWSAFSIIRVKLPTLEEQMAIANVLKSADKEIQLLKNKLEQLKLQKKGLMQVLLTGKKRLIK